MTIDISHALAVTGWMLPEELIWLADQASTRPVIIEVGIWKGRSTAALAANCPGTVFAVDHFRGSISERDGPQNEASTPEGSGRLKAEAMATLATWIIAGRLFVLPLDSADAATALVAVLGERKADMVFIDGDHDFSACSCDIRLYRQLLRPGGLLCGHDRNFHGVLRSINDLEPGWKPGPGFIWEVTV